MADNRSVLRSPSVQPDENLGEEIQRRAYELYIQRGHTDGHDLDDWLQAEGEIRVHPSRRTPSGIQLSPRHES